MALKRKCAMLFCFVLAVFILKASAAAANKTIDQGVYTGKVVTTYYNPDTGKADDSGKENAALGEGMCRSATDTKGLLEIDGEGNVWVTLRLLLQSSCKDVAISTRTGKDSYTAVKYEVTSEDAANDSVDYRFKVPKAGVKIKVNMYVTPMGRDVQWYCYLDTGTLTAGRGNFAVDIDTATKKKVDKVQLSDKKSNTAASKSGTAKSGTFEAELKVEPSNTTEAEPAELVTPAKDKKAVSGEAKKNEAEASIQIKPVVEHEVSEEKKGNSVPADNPVTADKTNEASKDFRNNVGAENSVKPSSGIAAGTAAVVIIAGALTIFLKRRRK